jgi:hypothetical protein
MLKTLSRASVIDARYLDSIQVELLINLSEPMPELPSDYLLLRAQRTQLLKALQVPKNELYKKWALKIKKVIFNNPATIVIWDDGTKTVVKAQRGETFDKEKGLALAISKKVLGNKGNFNNVFKKYIEEE